MNTNKLIPVLLVLPLAFTTLACPTRAGDNPDGDDTSGEGGAGASVACAPACDATHTCVGSQCLLDDGGSCSLAAQCASGACTAFYVDADGDGFGSGAAMGFCGTTAPVGYAAMNGDCCDDATHLAVAKLIHPGAGFQTTSAGGVCNITWDYDCSGEIEKAAQACNTCSPSPSCACVLTDFPDSDCGTHQETAACYSEGTSCGNTGNPGYTLGCR